MSATILTTLRVARQVTTWGAKAANKPAPPLKEVRPDVTTVLSLVGGDDGRETIAVTSEQSQQMGRFLEDPAVIALQRLAFIKRLLPAVDRKALESFSAETSFASMAQSWCAERSETWADLSDELWRSIETDQQTVVAQLVQSGEGISEEIADALAHRFFFNRLGIDREPEFVRRLDDVAKSPDRQGRLRSILDECRRAAATHEHDKFLIQGIEERQASFTTLYIDRHLTGATTGRQYSAQDELDLATSRPRVVIIGDPGVGKTTLTAWMKWRLAGQQATESTPIAVTLVSRATLTEPAASVLGALKGQMERDFQIALTDEEVADLLATGWIALIVDGIDEILNQAQRRTIVEQLHTFAERFPFVPIVCTTRRTGFEVSLFKPAVFQVLNLQEYSEAQVQEYANRWFSQYGAKLKVERFMGESRTLVDLRRNPLMLALLCTLFRQYDFIPRSRRDVYLRCASLMFHEWDPSRGIAIPNLFKNEGEGILRDIALLFHQTEGAGRTIEEPQLVQLISGFLKDRGTDPVGADTAARELLEHCSGRAWILSRTGTEGEVPRFSFTHRTFFEFFAAEAIIRRVNRDNELRPSATGKTTGLGSVARAIASAYMRDSTSVMPELLLQAADDLMGGVSTAVMTELRNEALYGATETRSTFTSLSVRLVAAAGVSVTLAEDVFRSMLQFWENSGESEPKLAEFTPLLDVASGHRVRLLAMLKDQPKDARQFLRRYARLALLGEAGLFSDEWREAALESFSAAELRAAEPDAAVIRYGVDVGKYDLDVAVRAARRGRDLIYLEVEDQILPGLLWSTIAPSNDPKTREETWRIASRMLLSEPDLRSNDPHLAAFARQLRGVVEERFPPDLAVALALLTGSEGDLPLAVMTVQPNLAGFMAVLRAERSRGDRELDLRLAKETPEQRERKAAIRDRLNAAYRRAWPGQRAPVWIKDYVGLGPNRSMTLAWPGYPVD